MLVKNIALTITALLLTLNVSSALAVPILDKPVSPDYYHCQGKNADLLLYTNALGTTTLKLTLDGIVHKTQNDNISSENTVIGDLKEITIGFRPDVSVTKASVIIPSILLGPDVPHLKFRTQLAITTVIQSMIATLPQGIINNSKYIDLVCKAKVLNP